MELCIIQWVATVLIDFRRYLPCDENVCPVDVLWLMRVTLTMLQFKLAITNRQPAFHSSGGYYIEVNVADSLSPALYYCTTSKSTMTCENVDGSFFTWFVSFNWKNESLRLSHDEHVAWISAGIPPIWSICMSPRDISDVRVCLELPYLLSCVAYTL